MNRTQQDYLKSRIRDIKSAKVKEATEKYVIELTYQQRFDLVKKGKVKPIFSNHASQYCSRTKSFDFNFDSFEKDAKKVPAYNKAMRILDEIALRIEDEIMLGDCEKATALLHQFESVTV